MARKFCSALRSAIADEKAAVKEYDKLSSSVFEVDVYRGSSIVLIRDDESGHARVLQEIFDELCR